MNKHLIVLGIAVLLICVGLSGCTSENNKDTNNDLAKFVGTWESQDENAMYLFGDTVTFFSNGSLIAGTLEHEGFYEIKDGKLFVSYPEYGNEGAPRDYSCSNNDTILTLTDPTWEKTAVYTKQ